MASPRLAAPMSIKEDWVWHVVWYVELLVLQHDSSPKKIKPELLVQNLKVIRVSPNIRLMARAKNTERMKFSNDTILTPNSSSRYIINLIPLISRKNRNGTSLLIMTI